MGIPRKKGKHFKRRIFMKKIMSLLLVLTLAFSLSLSVFAAGPSGTAEGQENGLVVETQAANAAVPSQVKFQKVYKNSAEQILGSNAYPQETLSFTVVPGPDNPKESVVTVDKHPMNANPDNDVIINIPAYDTVGKYNYTITEKAGTTQGVTYSTTPINLQVVVTNAPGPDGGLLKTVAFTSKSDGKKVNNIVNIYDVTDGSADSALSFSVQKKVAGDLAAKNAKFKVNVVLTATKDVMTNIEGGGNTYAPEAWKQGSGSKSLTIPLELTPDATASSITGVPKGVTYTVTEDEAHTGADSNKPTEGYKATYTVAGVSTGHEGKDFAAGKIGEGPNDVIVITNTKGATDGQGTKPNTGIYLDAVPYVILLAVAAAGILFLFVRNHKKEEY